MLKYALDYGINLSEQSVDKLDRYAELLCEWNEKINLTAITKPDEIVVKHFLDSLLLLKQIEIPQNAKLIDVGTGAGFPSLPVKIARDDIKLTMLDSLNKRINFLNEVTTQIGVDAECIHSRAEEGGRQALYREKYFIGTARAVAHLRELAEYCLPFVEVGGYFISLKGGEIDAELDEAKNAIKILGGKVQNVKKVTLPDGSGRSFIIIKKISQTPTNYPRPSAKMAKKPLK